MTNGQNVARSRHLEELAQAAKRYTLREILDVTEAVATELGGLSIANYADATTVSSGLMSATDKAKLDNLTNYTLPTASTTTKGGVKIGSGLQMDGDTLSVTLQSCSSGSSGGTVLDTVPATVDGGIWYEMFNDKPVLKIRKGDYNYVFENSRIQRATASEYLVAWLRFNKSTTYDECGIHMWEAVGTPTIGATNSFNGNALQVTDGNYVQCIDGITLGGQDFTVDCWFYCGNENPYYAEMVFFGKTETDSSTRLSSAVIDLNSFGCSMCGAWYTVRRTNWLRMIDPTTATLANPEADVEASSFTKKLLHCALVYSHSRRRTYGFLNGHCFGCYITQMFETSTTYPFVKIGMGHLNNGKFMGAISEFRIHDGVALWTEDFTPPTAADYL